MGFGDVFKKVFAAINPVQAIGTGLAIGSDLYGAHESRRATEHANRTAAEIAAADRAQQKEFAQMGIRWRVEDAQAAGIHPLAAVGATGATYSPTGQQLFVDDSRANFARSMGQNIQRAISVTSTPYERTVQKLNLERLGLENKLLKRQIDASPSFPSDLGVNLPGVNDASTHAVNNYLEQVPVRRTASTPGRPYQDAAHVADYSYARTPHGLTIVPSKDVKERIEDQLIPEAAWAVRNTLLPNMPGGHFPVPSVKEYPLPAEHRRQGYKSWQWSYTLQQFVPSKRPEGETIFRRFRRFLGLEK